MSGYSEANTTNELLDYLGQDCEWAAECVRARYSTLKRERSEVEADNALLREQRDSYQRVGIATLTELSALKDAARAVVDDFKPSVLWSDNLKALAALL